MHRVPVCRACCVFPDASVAFGASYVWRDSCFSWFRKAWRWHTHTPSHLHKTFQCLRKPSRIMSGLHSNSNCTSPFFWKPIQPLLYILGWITGVWMCSDDYRCIIESFIVSSSCWCGPRFTQLFSAALSSNPTRDAAFSRWERTRNSISTPTEMRTNPLYWPSCSVWDKSMSAWPGFIGLQPVSKWG